MLHTNIKPLDEKHKQTSILRGCRVFNSTTVGRGLDFHPTTVNSHLSQKYEVFSGGKQSPCPQKEKIIFKTFCLLE